MNADGRSGSGLGNHRASSTCATQPLLALLERIESLPEENQPHSPVRANILCAVGLLGRQAAEATPILRRLATHRDPYVAFAASTALAAISNGEAPT